MVCLIDETIDSDDTRQMVSSPRKAERIDWEGVKEELREELEESIRLEVEKAQQSSPDDATGCDFEKAKLGAKAYGVMSQAWSQLQAARLDYEITERKVKQLESNESLEKRHWRKRFPLVDGRDNNIK